MKFTPAVILITIGLPGVFAQQSTPASNPVIRSSTQEVVLDIVVRDKKGKLIRDLEPGDIELNDDGARQKIRSFRLVTGAEAAGTVAPAVETSGGKTAPQATAKAAADPLRQIRVVTFAFERLGPDGRKLSRQAALDLLKNEAGSNLYFGVFAIDQHLSLLQQYTSDKEAVKTAINRATAMDYSLYLNESERAAQEVKAEAALSGSQGGETASGPISSADVGAKVSAAMAQMTLNMLQFSQSMERLQQGRASISGLWSLVKEQNRLPGRKTLLYFTEGLQVPPHLTDQFKSIIAAANRANVSVYAMDTKGLVSDVQNGAGGSMLAQATGSIRNQARARYGPVTPDQARAIDLAEDSTRANTQNSLAELSEGTGGFMIANTNDLRVPLRRVSEEIGTYYEVTYSPEIDKYDGHFRKISVRVARADARVQTRSGYFALPALDGQSLLPYELPMLSALASTPVPRAIPFRSAAFHHQLKDGNANMAVVIDVPLDAIAFTKDDAKQMYRTHISVLAIFRNPAGTVVQKFTRDVPAQGPLNTLDAVRAGHFIYTQHTQLPPGRYTLETAIVDRETLKVSGKRQAVIVPEGGKGLAISDVSLVRSVSQETKQSDPEDPFQFQGGKVTPALDDTIKGGPGANLALYFSVYPQTGTPEEPKLMMEFVQDGKLVARGEQKLPSPDAAGRITYIARSPVDTLKPGQYEVRVTATQGGASAQEHVMVTIE